MKAHALLTILMIAVSSSLYAQRNFFVGMDIATGSTFTRVSYDDYRYQHLKGQYGGTFNLGIDLRLDFKKRMSFSTGAFISGIMYRVGFPYPPKPDAMSLVVSYPKRIGFNTFEHRIGVPVMFKYRFPLKKHENISLGIDAGFFMNFSTGSTGGFAFSSYLYNTTDSTGESTYAGYNIPGAGNILFTVGFGVDKIIGKHSLINISLLANIGTNTILNGEFLYYDHYIELPPLGTINYKPSDVPTESYRFYSRNSSILLKVTYFFAIKKLRE